MARPLRIEFADALYTYDQPLVYAESIRTQYIADIGQITTPIITSGWRNPERNERVGGVRKSNHQFGAAVDLVPDLNDLSEDNFPVIFDINKPNAAATTWCELAKSAYNAGNAHQTLVENTRRKPKNVNATYYRSLASAIYYHYDNNPGPNNFTNCVSAVRSDIETCRNNQIQLNTQNPDQNNLADENVVCSPNHIHTARN